MKTNDIFLHGFKPEQELTQAMELLESFFRPEGASVDTYMFADDDPGGTGRALEYHRFKLQKIKHTPLRESSFHIEGGNTGYIELLPEYGIHITVRTHMLKHTDTSRNTINSRHSIFNQHTTEIVLLGDALTIVTPYHFYQDCHEVSFKKWGFVRR